MIQILYKTMETKITHKEYLNAINVIEQYKCQLKSDLNIKLLRINNQTKYSKILPTTILNDLDISVRTSNAFRWNFDKGTNITLEEIYLNCTKTSLLKLKNMGKSSVNEIDQLLSLIGLSLNK